MLFPDVPALRDERANPVKIFRDGKEHARTVTIEELPIENDHLTVVLLSEIAPGKNDMRSRHRCDRDCEPGVQIAPRQRSAQDQTGRRRGGQTIPVGLQRGLSNLVRASGSGQLFHFHQVSDAGAGTLSDRFGKRGSTRLAAQADRVP